MSFSRNFPYTITLLLWAIFFPIHGWGKERTPEGSVAVSGEGIYYLEGKDTPDYAKAMAIQMARANAIGKAFGTAVSASTHSSEDFVTGGEERNSFSSVMRTLQTGIWVKDIEEPVVVSFLDSDSSFGYKAIVKGLARQLKTSPIETKGRLLVGGGRPGASGHETESLKTGEEFFFSFKAATDGWLAIYLIDEEGNVCRAAPASGSGIGLISVSADNTSIVKDDYLKNIAAITDPTERVVFNRIVYVFSPTPFTKPLGDDADKDTGLPTMTDYDHFHSWLQDNAITDEHFTVTWQTIRIHR